MQGIQRAKSLRKNSTDAERLLWYRLRDRRFFGHKFRRQAVIGSYIADFVCMSARVIIELDGGQHSQQIHYDREREHYLNAQGFRVVRFWNNEVFGNLEGVLATLAEALGEHLSG